MTKKKLNTKITGQSVKIQNLVHSSLRNESISRLFRFKTIEDALYFALAIKAELILLKDASGETIESEILVSQMYQKLEQLKNDNYAILYSNYHMFYSDKLLVEPYVFISIGYSDDSIDFIKKVKMINDLYEDENLLSEYIKNIKKYCKNNEYYFLDVIGLIKSCDFINDFKQLKFLSSYFYMNGEKAKNDVSFLCPKEEPEAEKDSNFELMKRFKLSPKDYVPLLALKQYLIEYEINECAIKPSFSCKSIYL